MQVMKVASYNNFQRNNVKNKNIHNVFKKPGKIYTKKELDEKTKKQYILWTTFYRRNIHIFCTHFLGVKLRLYQIFWLYLMSKSSLFMCIASRASAKSFIIGLYITVECILRPGLIVCITSGSKAQSGLIVSEKIRDYFKAEYSMIAREIKNIICSNDKYEIHFHNGSKIIVKPSSDLSRGIRSNINIYEESRIIDKEIIDTVFTPFLISRQPPYLNEEKYKKDIYLEPSKEIYITSAWFKNSTTWTDFTNTVKMHYEGKRAFFLAFDYLLTLKEKIKTKEELEQAKAKSTDMSWCQEFENRMYNETDDAFFKFSDFAKNRVLKQAWIQPNITDSETTLRQKHMRKNEGEIRVVSFDVAYRGGKANDNSVLSCARLIPTSKGYIRELVYMDSFNGMNGLHQVLKAKRLFYDFEADYFVIDIVTIGLPTYDIFSNVTEDIERGIRYDAWKTMDHPTISNLEDLKSRAYSLNAVPLIYPITGSLEKNDLIAKDFNDKIKSGMFKFLVDESKADDYFLKTIVKKNKKTQEDSISDPNVKINFLKPYIQTTALINETVSLEQTLMSGKIKLVEADRMSRKDRYSSCSYLNYFASLKDAEILKETESDDCDWKQYMAFGKTSFN
jgi:hypothetical protein